ncbi:nucleotidyltransferase family protein [Emticicia sp. 17c]|uniref:nucleotidyltransferase family protein n=1 Tax=Emticicia sp. 17c TaxID=3127704 RepID=UPI00301C2675
MSKPTLLILAAGMGSRYGGIKQLDKFGPNGETIIDYSIYDAIKAGFGKIVFIIREELKADFQEIFGPKLEGKIDYDFAIQSVQSYVPADLGTVERTKPWGTGHAVLCAWEQTSTPFAVINADDFYGYEGFQIMADFLANNQDPTCHAMVGYQIKNTLSENGSVSRGVCELDKDGFLEVVTERTKIYRQPEGQIVFEEGDTLTNLDDNTIVSMNFWGFMPNVFPVIHEMFKEYATKNLHSPKAEFYIPTVMTHLIQHNLGKCKVFSNESEWFGVTYPEDKPTVTEALRKLSEQGKYSA